MLLVGHTTRPLNIIVSVGCSWSLRSAPSSMLSARPRALALPSGPILISGGRPALNLWVNEDGTAKQWQTLDIPTEHNKKMADPALKFCRAFENANMSLGWSESDGYTQILALSPTVALVCCEHYILPCAHLHCDGEMRARCERRYWRCYNVDVMGADIPDTAFKFWQTSGRHGASRKRSRWSARFRWATAQPSSACVSGWNKHR